MIAITCAPAATAAWAGSSNQPSSHTSRPMLTPSTSSTQGSVPGVK